MGVEKKIRNISGYKSDSFLLDSYSDEERSILLARRRINNIDSNTKSIYESLLKGVNTILKNVVLEYCLPILSNDSLSV